MRAKVSDIVDEVELCRQRAYVFTKLRCFLVQHFRSGRSPGDVAPEILLSIAEQLLLAANDAKQRAELLMSQPVCRREK